MNRFRATSLLLVALLWLISEQRSASADDSNGLTITIEFDETTANHTVDLDTPLRVVLTNSSDLPCRIWNPTGEKGRDVLSVQFRNVRTGETHVLTGVPDRDEVSAFDDGPYEVLELESHESFVMHFSLAAYVPDDPPTRVLPDPNTEDEFLVSAAFRSNGGIATAGPPVWKGEAVSEEFRTRFAAKRLKAPLDYLRYGFTRRAIEILENDPSWITRGRATLHTAVSTRNVDAVKWLVEHGANVNWTVENGYTPLHYADDIEIVKLLLAGHPDLEVKDHAQGRTPLQEAAANFADAKNDDERQKWQQIVQLYRETGAEYDVLTAIYLSDLDQVKAKFDPSKVRTDGFYEENPLRLAASLGRTDICRYLIEEHHVDVNAFEQGGGYPIIKDAMAFPDVVRLLIDNGADLQTRITWRGGRSGIWIVGDDATALHYAAVNGVPETVKLLIDSGVDIFATAHDRFQPVGTQTALDVAAYFGKAENARAILTHPRFKLADAEVRQQILDRSLGLAAQSSWLPDSTNDRRPELMVALLEHGANPLSKGFASTAVQMAALSIHPNHPEQNESIRKIISALVSHGAEFDMFTAVALGDEEQVLRLLQTDRGLANARGADGYPALHKAVSMNRTTILAKLIEAGGDLEIRNQSEMTGSLDATALHCGAFWGRVKIAKLLIAAGADVNARDKRQFTPLHDAARMGSAQVAALLLEHGAQVDAVDEDGATPLDVCRDAPWINTDEVELLLRRNGDDG